MTLFDPNQINHQPSSNGMEADESKKDTNLLRFYRATGNWAEFGLFFCGGLTLAFLSRLIPGMMVFYVIVLGAIAAYLWIVIQGDDPRQQKETKVIGLAIAFSVIAGHWDAALLGTKALLDGMTPIHWIVVAAVVTGLFAIITRRGAK
jgi:hypothetical protein